MSVFPSAVFGSSLRNVGILFRAQPPPSLARGVRVDIRPALGFLDEDNESQPR